LLSQRKKKLKCTGNSQQLEDMTQAFHLHGSGLMT
jgi:hypothetical protein